MGDHFKALEKLRNKRGLNLLGIAIEKNIYHIFSFYLQDKDYEY